MIEYGSCGSPKRFQVLRTLKGWPVNNRIPQTRQRAQLLTASGQGYVHNIELIRTTLKLLENRSIKNEDLKKWNNGKKVEIKLDTINSKSIIIKK